MSLEVIASARATRRFESDRVDSGQLRRIIEAARWTGSARNRQPWRFVAVTDAWRRERLAVLGKYAQHLAAAPLVLVVLSQENGHLDTEFDVGRVVQSVTLAAHELGLGSCLATFHPADNVAEASTLVGAPSGWTPRHAIALGYTAASPPSMGTSAIPTGRLTTDELLLATFEPPPAAG